MLLTITNTKTPATDLGHLLHKNPSRVQSFELSFGKAHVFYPEASANRCTAALLLDVDPVGLVRTRRGPSGEGGMLDQYVNDRPYVASSFMSVAIARIFNSALAGNSKDRPELVTVPLPLTARIAVVPCRGGEEFLRRLFEPLGYQVIAQHHPLDEEFPEWGEGPYYTVEISKNVTLQDLLTHLYVLIPVLDADKHYWVGKDEIEKLLRHGEGWLQAHPEREAIVNRYLRGFRNLTREALARLTEDESRDPDAEQGTKEEQEQAIEAPIRLHDARLQQVVSELKANSAKRVLDLGCGEGKLVRELLKDKQFEEIVGMDVSYRSLEVAAERLYLDTLPPKQKGRLKPIQGSLMYRDKRLAGFDAAAVVEVIEHLDEPRLAAFERVLFEFARPQTVVMTTPNAEYNVKFETLPAGQFRHRDHRFEWTREEFQSWANGIGERFGYSVDFKPVGEEDQQVGGTDSDGSVPAMKITVPELSLVLLVGPSGCGKSTFARQQFKPTEVLSSDYCRGLVSDDENDQTSTKEAFEVLHFIARKRLAAGRLTVDDATNVQPDSRKLLVALAREFHVLPIAIVFDFPEKVCQERNRTRPNRDFGPHVVRNQAQQLRRSLRGLEREGFRGVHVFKSPEELEGLEIVRQPMWTNRRNEHGPFDIIGDVHGCFEELRELMTTLGYSVENNGDGYRVVTPEGRKAIFLGDLVDRGPKIPDVVRVVIGMVESGTALCVPGNHDTKLLQKLRGKDVKMAHGLADSVAQLEAEPPEFKSKVAEFLDGLISHYVLDDGKADRRSRGHERGDAGARLWRDPFIRALRRDYWRNR